MTKKGDKMKIYLLFFLIIVNTAVFGELNDLSTIKTLKIVLTEKLMISNEKKESKYNLLFEKPDKVRKEVLSPSLNKGEIYIYNKNKKMVYLPLFEQFIEKKTTDDENEIIKILNYLLNREKNDKTFKNKYYKREIKEIFIDNDRKINITNLKTFGNYLLPTKFKIYNKGVLVAELQVSDYKINPFFNKEEFQIK